MSRPDFIDDNIRDEIEELAGKKKVEKARVSEEKHKELQRQFKEFSERQWYKRFEEETKALKEQKRIEEAEEQERYEEECSFEKRGMIEVEKSISKVTLTFTGEEARELLSDIEIAVGLRNYPVTLLEKLGVYLAEELGE